MTLPQPARRRLLPRSPYRFTRRGREQAGGCQLLRFAACLTRPDGTSARVPGQLDPVESTHPRPRILASNKRSIKRLRPDDGRGWAGPCPSRTYFPGSGSLNPVSSRCRPVPASSRGRSTHSTMSTWRDSSRLVSLSLAVQRQANYRGGSTASIRTACRPWISKSNQPSAPGWMSRPATGPHQAATSAGSVSACQTRSRSALSSNRRRIPRFPRLRRKMCAELGKLVEPAKRVRVEVAPPRSGAARMARCA